LDLSELCDPSGVHDRFLNGGEHDCGAWEGPQMVIGQTPPTLANDRWRARAALRRDESCAFDHDVSIQRSFIEKRREARPRSNVSMTIMWPPQHGHEREGEVSSALLSSLARACSF
jgi:hypothetical protein